MIRIKQRARGAWLSAALVLATPFAVAQANEGDAAELKAEVARVRQVGPADVALRDQARLELPEGAMFVHSPPPTRSSSRWATIRTIASSA